MRKILGQMLILAIIGLFFGAGVEQSIHAELSEVKDDSCINESQPTYPTEIKIENIMVEKGIVTASICNNGNCQCNVNWVLSISGGFLDTISIQNSDCCCLDCLSTKQISNDETIKGIGFANILIEADSAKAQKVSSEINCFVFGSFVMMLK